MLLSRAAARLPRVRAQRIALPARRYYSLDQSKFLKVSEEIRDAVATGKPVVALESTIYTHGFPYPESVALASLLESVVRVNGGVPATIGILNGVARVGLNADEIIELASTAETKSALKVSRRDLGYICGLGLAGKRLHGGTTVSGTMILAHLAGIRVFGTGGLGGVHRGGENSMDISADLTELGRTPVAVISSGCKSFLDIPRTLEYLETEGVCVGTFADGRQGSVDFPAFFTRDSGIKSPKVIQDEAEAAAIIYAQSKLPLSSGMHFANPVPLEQSIPMHEMDAIIEEAIRLAEVEGFRGSDNTPFVLGKIKELSGGKSVAANRALVEANVERATKVAVELAKLEQAVGSKDRHMPAISGTTRADQRTEAEPPHPPPTKSPATEQVPDKVDILVAGSLAIDLACDYVPPAGEKTIDPLASTSNPAAISQSIGGVGQNVAIAAHYLGSSVLFCSVVGDDLGGRTALAGLRAENLSTTGIQVLTGSRTAQYVAINDAKKDLVLAMADMGIMEQPETALDFDTVWEPLVARTKPQWVVVDANWSPAVMGRWIAVARRHGARVAVEPVSTAKSRRLFDGADAPISAADCVPRHAVSLAAPNQLELAEMYAAAREHGLFDSDGWWGVIDAMGMSSAGSRDRLVALTSAQMVDQGIPQQSIQLLPFVPCIVTKLGAQGVLVTQLLRPGDPRLTAPESAPYILSRASGDAAIGGVYMRLFPPAAVLADADVVSVNGAGDTLLGAVVSGLARGAATVEEVIPLAQRASVLTLQSAGGVSRELRGLSST
ncbi:hypothetical protein HFD88_003436 [Aspergillus terreus]|nr:hypothetical protein HFD88_003436 [Aspergillus terreus]